MSAAPRSTQFTPGGHTPVMLAEVLELLNPQDGGIYVDGTFGAGGYATAILEAAHCSVCGIDRDPEAVARAEPLTQRFGDRLTIIEGRFGSMDLLLIGRGIEAVDGIALDLGVSSLQLDAPDRGFSFRRDGPLDMRMTQGAGPTAAYVVNTLAESELAEIIFRFGEEKRARRVARAIVAARARAPIERTQQLAEIVRGVVRPGPQGTDPATRTFQALRIYVNDELGELARGLCAAERLLRPGGILAVVSFHSLEDRPTKEFFRERGRPPARGSRHVPDGASAGSFRAPTFDLLTRRARRPGPAECAANPRARSARLRAGRRTAAVAWAEHSTGGW